MANNFTFQPELFKAGYIDNIQKNVRLFNESTNGVISLSAKNAEGILEKEKFFSLTADAVQRASRGDYADADTHAVDEDQVERAYIDGLFGPFEMSQLEQMAAGRSDGEMMEFLGAQAADLVFEDYAESLFSGLVGSITSESSLVHTTDDGSGNMTEMDAEALNEGMANFGDQRGELRLLIMHSNVERDLIADAISGADPEVEYGAIQGRPATLGLPYITADLDALEISGGGYRTVAVRRGGAAVEEIDQPELQQSGLQFKKAGVSNKVGADFRFNVLSQGFSYNGPANPTKAELADSTNWTFKMNDVKAASGVIVETA